GLTLPVVEAQIEHDVDSDPLGAVHGAHHHIDGNQVLGSPLDADIAILGGGDVARERLAVDGGRLGHGAQVLAKVGDGGGGAARGGVEGAVTDAGDGAD